jgi:hypothetical protein
MKGVGRTYWQTFIDTYAKVAFVKLYDRKTPITPPTSLTIGSCRSTTPNRVKWKAGLPPNPHRQ